MGAVVVVLAGGARHAIWVGVRLLIVSAVIGLAGCSLDVGTLCAAGGGTYGGGTCTRWSPSQQVAQDACETHGGVYLAGQETCEFGEGGP